MITIPCSFLSMRIETQTSHAQKQQRTDMSTPAQWAQQGGRLCNFTSNICLAPRFHCEKQTSELSAAQRRVWHLFLQQYSCINMYLVIILAKQKSRKRTHYRDCVMILYHEYRGS